MPDTSSNRPAMQKNGHNAPVAGLPARIDSPESDMPSESSDRAEQPAKAASVSSLQERIRQGTNTFQFDALLEGVSTLDKPIAVIAAPDRAPERQSLKGTWALLGSFGLIAAVATGLALHAKQAASPQKPAAAAHASTRSAPHYSGPALPVAKGADVVIYAAGLAPGWQDWSWASRKVDSTGVYFKGGRVVKMEPDNWKGIAFHHVPIQTKNITALSFWIHGGKAGGQQIWARAADKEWQFGPRVDVGGVLPGGKIPANQWAQVTIPLKEFQAASSLTGIIFQAGSSSVQSTVYFADIKLTSR